MRVGLNNERKLWLSISREAHTEATYIGDGCHYKLSETSILFIFPSNFSLFNKAGNFIF